MLNGEPRPSANSVLDASALLALINQEAGAEHVREAVEAGAVVSAVNFVEVVSKLVDADLEEPAILRILEAIHVDIVEFTETQALRAGLLREMTKRAGLSLADRACLALAGELGLPALTADRGWSRLGLAVEVVLIR